MAKSNTSKKVMNMIYGLGASVVIIGALFKLMHWPYGDLMLIIGLVTEAIVFAVSAFEPVDSELDWSKVYPELAGEDADSRAREGVEADEEEKGILSQKLDEMLKEARIDSNLMESLGESIRSFESAAKNLSPTTDGINSQKKYSEELSLAAAQMESLNNLYKAQVESASKQAQINEAVADNASKLREQMESLTKNLNSLNGVYGGMLSAMQPKA
ncbi:type IX secretion system motor protein PorL/GldL [Psychroflexus sp. MBR-150]|jgi:gliding motility-associated protein GldL